MASHTRARTTSRTEWWLCASAAVSALAMLMHPVAWLLGLGTAVVALVLLFRRGERRRAPLVAAVGFVAASTSILVIVGIATQELVSTTDDEVTVVRIE